MSRLASRRLVLAVVASQVVLGTLGVAFSRAQASGGGGPGSLILSVALLSVGSIVAYKRPDHRMGWLMMGGSGFLLLANVGASYSVLDYRDHQGRLPLGPAAVLVEPSWAPAIVMFVLCLMLYPDGRLPSRGWRWPVGGLFALAAAWQLGAFGIAVEAIISGRIDVTASGDLYQVVYPSGAWAWWGVVQLLFFLAVALTLLTWFVSQAIGYRRLSGERRLQQKWLLGGAAIAVASFLLFIPPAVTNSSFAPVLSTISTLGVSALPIAIGIGVLRFRLYEIDRLISRTLAYAIVTVLLAGTFVGLVLLTTRVLPFSSTVGVAASTLAAAALFNPIRVRVQRAVDRRFNRARYDAEETVAAFAARLRDAIDVEAVEGDLLAVVDRAVQPAHASIWIRRSAAP